MNEARRPHAVVVCDGWVYAIGGYTGNSRLDTIEYIGVSDFLEMPTESKRKHWTTLDARLSSARDGLAVAVVRNRYIVVAGGHNSNLYNGYLSTVEIIDTKANGGPVVIPGLSLNKARSRHGIAVIENRVYVAGGYSSGDTSGSVEYMQFCENKSRSGVTFSSCWTVEQNRSFVESRSAHASLSLGSNIVLAGGDSGSGGLKSVRVLDTKDSVAWYLPGMTNARFGCTMVATSNGIVVIGGKEVDSCETLPLITKKQQIKVWHTIKSWW